MSPERWRKIDSVFHAALEKAPGDRQAFLKEAAAHDEDLRREVESLLQVQGDGLLDTPLWQTPEDDRLTPGTQLGPYRIVGSLGEGGMGLVYRALDTRLGREIALKISKAEFSGRFQREARAVASLNHPNICALYDIGPNYLVMELIEGPTLAERLAKGPIPVEETLEIARQIAGALVEAHARGIIHRDLKPSNIKLTAEGSAKILDFGLAKSLGPGPDNPQASPTLTFLKTGEGRILGTPLYMSPEQALGRPADKRSDLFSLGVVMYQIATGALPFQGKTSPEIADAILHQPVTAPVRLNPRIPAEFERIILRALEKDAALRYQSASDLLSDLKRLKRDTESSQQAPAMSGKAPVRKAWWVVVAALTVAVAAGAFLRSRHPAPAGDQTEMTIRPLLTSPTNERFPAFSPDGKTIAFSWDGEDGANDDIYVKLLDAGNALRLTAHRKAHGYPSSDWFPSWSPDGRFIAFVRINSGLGMQILTVPALGGQEGILVDERATHAGPVSWHPNGKSIAFENDPAGARPGLFLLDLESGQRRRLTTAPDGVVRDASPAFSPDGKRLAFSRYRSGQSGNIMLLTMDDGSLRSFPDSVWGIGIAWMPDGRSLLVGGGFGMAPDALKRVPLDSGSAIAIGIAGAGAAHPSVSPDGRRVVYEQNVSDSNIWHASLETPTRLGESRSWIASTRHDFEPRYSPDGTHILFVSDRTGRRELWLAEADGKNQQQLTSNSPAFGSPRWSPDGTRIVFDGRVNGNADIFVMNVSGGLAKRLTDDPAEDIVPTFSYDGRWIYFCSNRSGTQQVWRMPASGGAAEQITQDGGFDSQESADGKYLYYSKGRNRPGLARRGPDKREEMLLPDLYGRRWVASEKGIYYLNASDREGRLRYLDLATRRIAVLTAIPKIYFLTSRCIDLSPDGRELLWVQNDSNNKDLMLIENFR